MERLTIKLDNEKYPHGAEGKSEEMLTGNYCRGEFEATALVERLCKIENILFDENGEERISLERLKELIHADAESRLVVLPCKVGDTVYEVQELRKRIQPYTIISIHISRWGVLFGWELKDGEGIYTNVNGFCDYVIGKTVFLTREEAEAALEKMEE